MNRTRRKAIKLLQKQGRARLALATRCDCGPEPFSYGLVCHGPDCAFLKWCATESTAGFCTSCGVPLIIERGGLIRYCRFGHVHEMMGEAFLEVMDASGSGWIRDVLSEQPASTNAVDPVDGIVEG